MPQIHGRHWEAHWKCHYNPINRVVISGTRPFRQQPLSAETVAISIAISLGNTVKDTIRFDKVTSPVSATLKSVRGTTYEVSWELEQVDHD